MKIDISADDFESFSNEKKKKYIAELFINKSGALPVDDGSFPIAVITAGLPGAGKTEFLDILNEDIAFKSNRSFVRIDLDEIVSVYPDYSPKDYYKFRSKGNTVLERTIDTCIKGKYNMLIDGTFSSQSGASIKSVERLLSHNYIVIMFYIYDSAESAWLYTKKRKLETGRAVDITGFVNSAKGVCSNIRQVVGLYRDHEKFSISAVVQKKLRDKKYNIITQKDDIDNIVNLDYNLDTIKENDD